MSMSASEDPSEPESRGRDSEILKASSPGPDQVEIGMNVVSMDGEHVALCEPV